MDFDFMHHYLKTDFIWVSKAGTSSNGNVDSESKARYHTTIRSGL